MKTTKLIANILVTLAAIAAIKNIPAKVSYEDRHLVEAAREAYNKIATTLQQALVTNYADLISAEQRIVALTPTEEVPADAVDLQGATVIPGLIDAHTHMGTQAHIDAMLAAG